MRRRETAGCIGGAGLTKTIAILGAMMNLMSDETVWMAYEVERTIGFETADLTMRGGSYRGVRHYELRAGLRS